MNKEYKFYSHVKGIRANVMRGTIQPTKFVVQGTKDKLGLTLSIGDDLGTQFSIPLEPILQDLKNMIK